MVNMKKLIILAAGQGKRLRPLTNDRPKCLVHLGDRSLLNWQIEAAKKCGITDITVIGGYRAEQFKAYDVNLIVNPNYAHTNMVRSLFCGRDLFKNGFILSYGDIVYSSEVLSAIQNSSAEIGIAVDHQWKTYWSQRFEDPLSDAESLKLTSEGNIISIGQKVSTVDEIEGQYIGLTRFSKTGVDAIRTAYARAENDLRDGRPCFGRIQDLDNMYMTDFLQGMIDMGTLIKEIPIHGGWLEIDNKKDLQLAELLVANGRIDLNL